MKINMGLRDIVDLLDQGGSKRGSARDLIALMRFMKDPDGKKKKEDEKKGTWSADELTWIFFFGMPFVPLYLLMIWYIWGAALTVLVPHVHP